MGIHDMIGMSIIIGALLFVVISIVNLKRT